MSKIKRLAHAYSSYISIPWRPDDAPDQRVVFCVYNENDELRLRAAIDEFEILTRQAGHGWQLFDLTNTLAVWLLSQKYIKSYFQKPELLKTILHRYAEFITRSFSGFIKNNQADENSVVCLMGVGSLFGLIKVKDVVDKLSPMVPGKLVVLFPGSYENNNYRLLDGYDGWNYLAVPLTADSRYQEKQ